MTRNARQTRAQGVTPQIVATCAAQNGVATWAQIRSTGLSASAIRRRTEAQTLFEIYEKVFALSPVVTADGLRTAALLTFTSGSTMFDGWSALELCEVAPRPDGDHHVVTTGRIRDRDGLQIGHTGLTLPYRRVRGFALVRVDRALLTVAREVAGRDLERLVGEALYQRVVTERAIKTVGTRYPGHSGLHNLQAIDPSRARKRRTVREFAEQMLLAIDTLPVPPPICEYRLKGLSGKTYYADFAWPDRKIIVEADGRRSHERLAAMDSDRARDNDLGAVGWQTFRFTWKQFTVGRAEFERVVVAVVGV